MSIAEIHLELDNKIKAVKTDGNFTPILPYRIGPNESTIHKLETENMSPSTISFNSSNLRLNNYLDPSMRLGCYFQVTSNGRTSINVANMVAWTSTFCSPSLFDVTNATFDNLAMSKMIRRANVEINGKTFTLDESNLDVGLMEILSRAYDQSKMSEYGESARLNEHYGLPLFYKNSNSGQHIPYDGSSNVSPSTQSDVETFNNTFTDMNKPTRVKHISTTFTTDGGSGYTIAASTNFERFGREPVPVITAVPPAPVPPAAALTMNVGDIYYTSKDNLGAAVLTQTSIFYVEMNILLSYFHNIFARDAVQKPYWLNGLPLKLELSLNLNYITNCFKTSNYQIAFMETKIVTDPSSVAGTKRPRLIFETFNSNHISESDNKLKYMFTKAKRLVGLPFAKKTFAARVPTSDELKMNFSYSYKPTSVQKYQVIWIDPEYYNAPLGVGSNTMFMSYGPAAALGVAATHPPSILGYDFPTISNLDVIINNIDVLGNIFPDKNSEDKMDFLRKMTCKSIGTYSFYASLSTSERERIFLYYSNAGAVGERSYGFSGLPFVILDMQYILSLYKDPLNTLVDYNSGQIQIQYNIEAALQNKMIVKDYGFYPYFSNTNLPAVYNIGTFFLKIFDLEYFTLEQDLNTNDIREVKLMTTSEKFQTKLNELSSYKTDYAKQPQYITGGEFQEPGFLKYASMFDSFLKLFMKGTRFLRSNTKDSDAKLGQTVHKITDGISKTGKVFGYGSKVRYIE